MDNVVVVDNTAQLAKEPGESPPPGRSAARSDPVDAAGGRLLVIGFTGGDIPTVKVNRLLLNNIDAVGVGWGRGDDGGRVGDRQASEDDAEVTVRP